MPSKAELREIVRGQLDVAMGRLNEVLRGENLDVLQPSITRLGRGGVLPHWYEGLKVNGALPNLDGKTIGSVLEMLFVAILETAVFQNAGIEPLKINPARGVDLPDLDLGVKSPSTNYCTSEPFFSAYERLYGNEYDCVVMLTDYQTAKRHPPLRLQIIGWRYMRGSEVADEGLCTIAREHRDWLIQQGEAVTKRVFRFLAYVNQSDWRAKQLITLLGGLQNGDDWVQQIINRSSLDFERQNYQRARDDRELIPESDLEAIKAILTVTPHYAQITNELDNWVTETLKDAARAPNDNEWGRLIASPLNGKIGMSFALQWRYNFGRLFGNSRNGDDAGCDLTLNDCVT